MIVTPDNEIILNKVDQDSKLYYAIEAYLFDCHIRNLSKGTMAFYKQKLMKFFRFCASRDVSRMYQIDKSLIREFLYQLELDGHNPGGIHAFYRTLKTFFFWWEIEFEPENWKNPIRYVKAPKVPTKLLDPVNVDDAKEMAEICPQNTLLGLRDKAMILFLLDTGVRASELLSINLSEINLLSGQVLIRKGKGRKHRTVFVGATTKKAIRKYLRKRSDQFPALWISRTGDRLGYWGLRSMIRRRANQAGVDSPTIHAFRRWFALSCLRAGVNVYSIQELLGHADLQVMKRYLKQSNLDLRRDFLQASPVDNQY